MSSAAVIALASAAVGYPLPAIERAKEYARNSKAASTRRAYATDWKAFSLWASANGVAAMPAAPETIAAHISDMAQGYTVGTIQRRLSSISQAHQVAGFESPTQNPIVRNVFAGIKRELGVVYNQKAALVAKDLHAMVDALPDSLLGIRDRALLLFGFSGAFRRSELVALDVEDLTFTDDGLLVVIRKSKTDQERQGQRIGVPRLPGSDYCPVRALRAWLDAGMITTGPVFRAVLIGGRLQPSRLSDRAVALTVKKRLPDGYDASKYAGHSLRSGLVTAALAGGASLGSVMRTTRHKSLGMLLRYQRETNLLRKNALTVTGL